MGELTRLLSWKGEKVARRARQFVCSKLYLDLDPDPGRALIVAGTARSGTTWLADIIASQAPCRLMFEPYHSELVAEYSQFEYFHYMRAEDVDDGLLSFTEKVIRGRIRNRWIDRRVEHVLPKRRLIKEIRACLLLRWIREHFPQVPILFIIRHPCAVVASRMRLGWATDADIAPLLRQPRLVDDFLSDKLALIARLTGDAEKHAVIWSISNLVPLQQFREGGLDVVFYEDLLLNPRSEIPRIFAAINQDYRASIYGYVDRPSTTTVRGSAVVTGGDSVSGWKKHLSKQQTAEILTVVREFGLDHLYGDEETPIASSSYDG